MRNSLKRTLSLVLAVLMLGSVAVISASANSGERENHTLETALEWWEIEYGEEIPTTTYYFYMPDEWRNEYNDYYDGSDLASCLAGVYWYGSTLCLPDEYPDYSTHGWPGYVIDKKDSENVFVAEVPYDVHTIVFNNLVDGGMDKTLDVYTSAYQIVDTPTNYDVADNYGFYPNGLESTANMIFVVDPDATTVSDYTGKTVYNGAWFYYYGNGEYGTAPTKEEADNVYANGEFPASKLVVKPEKNVGIGVGTSIALNPTKTPVTYVSDNEAVAVVEEKDGKFFLKAVGKGDATITFTYFNEATEEEETATVTINVVTPSLNKDSIELEVGGSDFFIPTGISADAIWKSSNEKVATVEGGMVYAIGAGKATITVTQGDVVLKCPVTVKGGASLDSKKKVSIAAGATSKIKVSGSSNVTYKTNNKKVATVDKKGTVTGLKSGTAKITVKADGEKLATVTVTVTSNPKLATKNVTVKNGKTTTVKITGAASKPTVSKCAVAKITPAKKKLTIKGTKKGSKKVTVTVNGVKLKLTVKVN